MKDLLKVVRLGIISYGRGLRLQKEYEKLVFNEKAANYILLLEHKPVYTIGIRDYSSQYEEDYLKSLGAEFYKTSRGGLITFHGPGQLVVYPILNLKSLKIGVRKYTELLEETVIETCKNYNICGKRSQHTGVWVGDNKICALGIQVRRYISSHGLALNCATDLKWFNHITPCGIKDKGVTSLSNEVGRKIPVEEVLPLFIDSFEKTFKVRTDYA
ncbi:DgyrCDS10308 [Dimorphilus gyrociliatus]|uniref:Octanoyl-[acyl-carrier-protein]:protein N-octanoyltransferase LIPT2, mitochondrial n=1 Tax=Dimorphilus gyrociliatus TaxID=2664684 RepID=A0A7I8VZS3_9ANNE|nr:DgyrCDS10308 [Dimorphilus gyrociliatus]